MTQSQVKVTPSTLTSTASTIGTKIDAFEKEYKQLMSLVEQTAAWKGKDSEAYVAQIKGFKDDLEAMVKLVRAYKDLLEYSAKEYTDTQSELYNMGKKL